MEKGESEFKKLVSDAIKKTVNKFREYPYLFFTETDIHSYLYHNLYNKQLEVAMNDGYLTTVLHKEYPTNFRYTKKTMQEFGLQKFGDRGHYDIVILNPIFIQKSNLQDVINKNVRDVERRRGNIAEFGREIIAAIEVKYVINNSLQFIEDCEKDTKKLSIGLKYQDFEAYNLVFCNHQYHYMDLLKDSIMKSNLSIKCVLTISYGIHSKKQIPKPITNGWSL